jgi:mRNA-degrading endonuclease toxin of MazEF toxin-antitoxin module
VKRGDIYLVSLDPTVGHWQQGTRPVLLVSPDRFNTVTGVPIVVPITSGGASPAMPGSPFRLLRPACAPVVLFAVTSLGRSI